MKYIKVRGLKIGEGIPKICVPIVGRTLDEVLEQAREIAALPVDLVEWRCDWFEHAADCEKVLEATRALRELLGEIPLLFTFRTAEEGGEQSIAPHAYMELNKAAASSGDVDLIDVQLFLGDEVLSELKAHAQGVGVYVVASNHDFEQTPSKAELVHRLQKMQRLGADIAKIAVMPKSEGDVQTLLAATREVSQSEESGPIITMSMSELGRKSRMEGEIHGSAVTFGSAREASAPGQIPVTELARLIREVHRKYSHYSQERHPHAYSSHDCAPVSSLCD